MRQWKAFLLAFIFLILQGCGVSTDNSIARETTEQQVIEQSEASQDTVHEEDQNPSRDVEVATAQETLTESTENTRNDIAEGSEFKIMFIDVGQADSAIINCDNHYMLIDGGNVADSSRIVAVLKKLGIEHLDYIINTHAHEDHVGGLAGALNVCSVGKVLSSVASYDTKAFNNFKKYTEAQGKSIEIPTLGEEIELGSSHVKILGPITFDEENVNNCSIVVKVVYGETSFLFTGDMEREEENEILEYWGENELSSTVLKVGHHGSETSTSYVFLRAVEPSYAVISVGTDNSYGHPSDNVLSRLRDADVQVYRTDLQGDIVITSNGKDIGIETEKNEKGNQNGDTTNVSNKNNEQSDYIGNTKSHKFHLNSCKSLPLEKNRVYFENREDAVNAGYEPCGNCKP